MKYDFLVVGAGLFGTVFAERMKQRGAKCLVIEKNPYIGGACHTETVGRIIMHKFGPHIFHTDNEDVWNYITSFGEFSPFYNQPIAFYNDEVYNLPFNLNTFAQIYHVQTPEQARKALNNDIVHFDCPENLEQKALSTVGKTIYEKLVKGYTEKQWGKKCSELPPEIISRLPIRMRYDNSYFDDKFQGIPKDGYTELFKRMLDGVEVKTRCEYSKEYSELADKTIFTGAIDKFYDYKFGKLEYRSLRFQHEYVQATSYQGTAVVNYTDSKVPWTRIVEHKFFDKRTYDVPYTAITIEYPEFYDGTNEAFYPINTPGNNEIYAKYVELSSRHKEVIFGGRTAEYKYYDMDDTIFNAVKLADEM